MKFNHRFMRLHIRLALATTAVTIFLTLLSDLTGGLEHATMNHSPVGGANRVLDSQTSRAASSHSADKAQGFNSAWILALAGDVAGTASIALVVGWLGGLVAARPYVRRLERLTDVSHEWAEGHLNRRINDVGGDELSLLSRRLDAMAGELSHEFALRQTVALAHERERLALEIHDGIKQQTFALSLHLGAARSHLLSPEAADDALGTSLEAAHELVEQMQRDLLSLMRAWTQALPPFLNEDLQCEEETMTLEEFLDHLRVRAGVWQAGFKDFALTMTLGDSSPLLLLPHKIAQEVEGLACEAIANAARHASATHVTVSLCTSRLDEHGKPMLQVMVEDDGQGFDVEEVKEGLGLMAMRERALRLPHGTLHLSSKPGRGCRVTVECSFPE